MWLLDGLFCFAGGPPARPVRSSPSLEKKSNNIKDRTPTPAMGGAPWDALAYLRRRGFRMSAGNKNTYRVNTHEVTPPHSSARSNSTNLWSRGGILLICCGTYCYGFLSPFFFLYLVAFRVSSSHVCRTQHQCTTVPPPSPPSPCAIPLHLMMGKHMLLYSTTPHPCLFCLDGSQARLLSTSKYFFWGGGAYIIHMHTFTMGPGKLCRLVQHVHAFVLCEAGMR